MAARAPWHLSWADTSIPENVPPLDGAELVPAAPGGVGGELDTLIDPRFPEYTANNLSEAFPGPMTPLSLTLSLRLMHAASAGMVDFLGLSGEIAHQLRVRGVGSFGHRIYVNVSVAREMAEAMPGTSPEEFEHQFLGRAAPVARHRMSGREALAALRLLGHIGPPAAGFGHTVRTLEERGRALLLSDEDLAALDDAALLARLTSVRDELAQAWNVACIANMFAAAAAGAVEASALRSGDDQLASAGVLFGVERLARRARQQPGVDTLLRSTKATDALVQLDGADGAFAAAFADLVATWGHRGPGETELANPMFADAPELLLECVTASLDAPSRPPATKKTGLAARVASGTMRTRERARDVVVRLTHELRRAARERGRRLAEADVLPDPDDVFFLTWDELLTAPDQVGALITPRRDERARLAALRLPTFFTGAWEPEPAVGPPLLPGETLFGIPASAGVVRAPVRVLRSPTDELAPGAVLVVSVTDTGWTPLFAGAAAVVTDIGGLLSHPAVVAREFGIPCVVGTGSATARLRDGQLVDVDGAAGTVSVVG